MTKPTMGDFNAFSWANSRGTLRIHRHGEPGKLYWTGDYLHPRGAIIVYRQADYTRLDYPLAGRVFSRSWKRWFGDRTITRLAKQMIEAADAGELV